jgi:hypothetical protein
VKTSRRATALLSGSAALLLLTLAAGCTPTCKEVCVKLLECDDVESPRVSEYECRDQCEREENLYEEWEDLQALEQHYDERDCIMGTECADIASGACYDEELYLF